MKLKLLRNLSRQDASDLLDESDSAGPHESKVFDVSEDAAKILLKRGLAESADIKGVPKAAPIAKAKEPEIKS